MVYLSADNYLKFFVRFCIKLLISIQKKTKQIILNLIFVLKGRIRIETLISQMKDQVLIRYYYAKTFLEYCTRILNKINT